MKNIFKKVNTVIYLIIALSFLIVGCLIGGAYAYYYEKNQADGNVQADNFYFSSDYLVEDGKTYTLNVGTTSVAIELRNFADALRHTDNDIEYEITITNGAKVEVSNQDDSDSSDSKVISKLTGNTKTSHTVTLSGLENGKEYTVTATGKAGYTKTLSATFKVRDVENKFYQKVSENDPYIILTIWTENISGTVTINFPKGLIPDNTCSGMENVLTNSGSFASEINEYSSYEFRFFKDTNYSSENGFVVTLITAQNETVNAIIK